MVGVSVAGKRVGMAVGVDRDDAHPPVNTNEAKIIRPRKNFVFMY